jgi:hypothetical protein
MLISGESYLLPDKPHALLSQMPRSTLVESNLFIRGKWDYGRHSVSNSAKKMTMESQNVKSLSPVE